ncbi:MAG: polymer-forming cytoskeletal protein [Candidatus Aminicenantes bacterium]|nr:polymer-forming cytoskeletal protein [Candidatus Aminicenantes bacterium]MBL7082252.1 polymer-forming cytoskeletal protein [Candidatus Aminicenantes bacterium]
MDNKKKMLDSDKITGFFDKDTEIDGNLTFKGSFRIDGHFKGKIDSESILIIGEKGKVEADVNIGYIIINGEIKGNIQATEKVEINATGRVIGSVITPKLIVEEGAYLETSCQTSDQIPLPKTKKEKEVEQGYQS